MKLKLSFVIAIVITSIGLISWEAYWRSKTETYKAVIEDDRYLWAEHRAKVEVATDQDIILIGSSRSGFNFNTHIWEDVQGLKPINLSTNGKPPGPFFSDIVENTDFNGTLVIGITPLFWFGVPETPRWRDAKQWINHYQNQTYAQKLGYQLSKPLQRHLVMLTASELNFYNDLDLKSLVNRFSIPGRVPESLPLYNFSYHDEDRNLMMFPIMRDDPDFAKSITDVWNDFLPGIPTFEVIKDEIPDIITYYKDLVDKFKARGGKLIFVRHKAEEPWNKVSERYLPRKYTWDVFVKTVDCPAYHFEDYNFMSKHTLPDWSHMYTNDAKIFTKDFVEQLIKDGQLKQRQHLNN
jgi:hypothetical protein